MNQKIITNKTELWSKVLNHITASLQAVANLMLLEAKR